MSKKNTKKLTNLPPVTKVSIPAKSEDPFSVMYSGQGVRSISKISKKDIVPNAILDTGIIEIKSKDTKIELFELSSLNKIVGVNCHKTLSMAIIQFAKVNNKDNLKNGRVQHHISFPLKEYARYRGYRIDPEEKCTPEEIRKEKQRAENALKRARRDISDELEQLFRITLSFSEIIGGKEENFADLRLISSKGIKNNQIVITFNPDYANCLLRLPQTKYAKRLFAISGKDSNTYNIGLGLLEHYAKYNNQKRRTHNRLIVKTILENYTNLPSYEEVLRINQSWRNRTKAPLEKSLNELVEANVLEYWNYGGANGDDLNYHEWCDLRIYFEIKDGGTVMKSGTVMKP